MDNNLFAALFGGPRPGGGGYCSQYQAVYDAMTNKPPAATAAKQNTFVQSLVDGGVWADLDLLYFLAQHTNAGGEALLNIINPAANTAVINGSPTFTADEGFTGTGLGGDFIDLPNMATAGSKYTLNDASFFVYVENDIQDDQSVIIIDDNPNYLGLTVWRTNNVGYYWINGPVGAVTNLTTSVGLHFVVRAASGSHAWYRNNVQVDSENDASSGIPNGTPALLPSTPYKVSFVGFGAAMNETKRQVIQDAIAAYKS